MFNSWNGFRHTVCGLFLGAIWLGLTHPALAWDKPLWVRQFGSTDVDYGISVAADRAGNVYLTGLGWGAIDGDGDSGDAWVAKYGPAGHALWKRRLGTPEWDSGFGVATDREGNVYVTLVPTRAQALGMLG